MSLDGMYLITVFVVALIAGMGWTIGCRIISAIWR